MNLSYSQFQNVPSPQNKPASSCKRPVPVVNQYLNLAIKQEKLRKMQEENKRLKDTNG